MYKITFFLVLTVFCAGCTGGGFSGWTEQSLLLQENQRLEHALYVTRAQLQNAKRENALLKGQEAGDRRQETGDISIPLRPNRLKTAPKEEAPPFETPKVEIPVDAPESITPPDALKGTMNMPEFPPVDEALVPPMWSPTR
ncbi:MAG: hypothetical protein LBN39_06655 [Planctomycetaceae bacterium]|jgi:hypothetical protein|nr:hypothetical protein [Planctomycetaceae bacterium]